MGKDINSRGQEGKESHQWKEGFQHFQKKRRGQKELSNLRDWKRWWWATYKNVSQGEQRQLATSRHWIGSEREAREAGWRLKSVGGRLHRIQGPGPSLVSPISLHTLLIPHHLQ